MRILLALVILLIAFLFLPILWPVLLVLFGWVGFLYRVLPEVRVYGPGVATAGLCLLLFAVGLHWTLRRFVAEWPRDGGTPPRTWPIRATAGIVVGVVVMFVAGMATTGVAHQIGWLATADRPWFRGSIAASRAQSNNNLKMIGYGFDNHDEARDALPRATFDPIGRPLHSWQTALLPYVEQESLYNQINLSIPRDDPRNAERFKTIVQTYVNPGVWPRKDRIDSGEGISHYAQNAWINMISRMSYIKDGTSNTMLAGEVATGFKAWGDPINWRDPSLGINRSPSGFGSPFPGGANVLFADGSVRFVKSSVDLKVMKSLGTPASGEKVNSDAY